MFAFQAIRLVRCLWPINNVNVTEEGNFRRETMAGVNSRFAGVTEEEIL